VPNEGLPLSIGSRVLVAWNGTREAARAVFDALPFLKAASAVKIVHIEAQGEADKMVQEATDICKTLRRHDVKCAATEKVYTANEVGHELSQQALSHRADLMVMGCYGHWRLREVLFGGASRHQLRHMKIPMLMSH
jgi:nucleotide-binding universal stress UspA family protein